MNCHGAFPASTPPVFLLLRLGIEADHIAQLAELWAANFNVTPLDSLKGKTPMEALGAWARDEELIRRHYPETKREDFCLSETQVEVVIACDLKSGKTPVVRYLHADYRGPLLSGMRSRRGERCKLIFRDNTAHIARLHNRRGDEIDVLTARGIWGSPHRLADRLAFAKLRKAQRLRNPASGETATEVLREHLSSRAATSKDAALALANLDAHTGSVQPAIVASEVASESEKAIAAAVLVTKKRRTRGRGDW